MTRHGLVQVFSIVTLLTVSFAPNANAQLRVRKNYTNLTPQERQDFVDAVKAVKANAEIGMAVLCSYTNTYDKYVCWHKECGCGGIGGAQHGRPQFLAWHRELLRQFELDLRTIGGKPNVTIPYWDWTEPFPSDLTTPGDNGFMGGTGTPLMNGPFRQGQWTTQGGGDLDRNQASPVAGITRNQLLQLLQSAFYDAATWDGNGQSANGLRDRLEGLHNTAHGHVGGHMGNSLTANDDPVFWLHHCFVDCMWAAWQDQHPNTPHYEPQNNEVPDDDDDAQMFPWSASTTPKSVLDFRALAEPGGQMTIGYTYQQNDSHGIPAISEWGMIVMALLALTAGTFVFARRRRPAAA